MSEIKVEGCNCVSNAIVYGLNESIKRAKYPMSVNVDELDERITNGIGALAKSESGAGHDQWLTGVIVQFDLTFSNKAWVEAERYHFFDFVSSQSTMHRITKFDLDKAYNKYVDPMIITIMKQKVLAYNNIVKSIEDGVIPQELLPVQKERRDKTYLEILYSNPAGFMLTAGMTTNYRQLKTIYHQRKGHRLPEWREFCDWIKTLPYSELITE